MVSSRNMAAGAILISRHNVAYMQNLTLAMREAIQEQRFPEYVRNFVRIQYPTAADCPLWVSEALTHAGIPPTWPETQCTVPTETI